VIFVALTAVVLVVDLERPERFYYILTRSNWRSWLVWGSWFLTGHGATSGAWLFAGWFGRASVVATLTTPAILFAILATSYTGFLFAQGRGRDLWQGPYPTLDLVAQSGTAGSAALLLASLLPGVDGGPARLLLVWTLAGSLAAHLVILLVENVFTASPTRHHELAIGTIRRGAYAPVFWGGAIAAGCVLPLAALALGGASGPAIVTLGASVLALAGSAAWEYIWVEAGQSVPLS
jgi:formate-dependent nitrite reductase membrane component NrfD